MINQIKTMQLEETPPISSLPKQHVKSAITPVHEDIITDIQAIEHAKTGTANRCDFRCLFLMT